MMFVKCVSLPPAGRFTVGRVYKAHDDLEGFALSRSAFNLHDDYDAKLKGQFSDGHFIELESVFVCCIEKCGSFTPGEILRVTGVDTTALNIDGFGWFNSKSFEVIDVSNLQVGSYLWDEPHNAWVDVKDIRDDQSVQVNGRPEFRPLNDFAMPVDEGNIDICPNPLTLKEL
jgi:hypothetical protein